MDFVDETLLEKCWERNKKNFRELAPQPKVSNQNLAVVWSQFSPNRQLSELFFFGEKLAEKFLISKCWEKGKHFFSGILYVGSQMNIQTKIYANYAV
jgi:hypothetical protein